MKLVKTGQDVENCVDRPENQGRASKRVLNGKGDREVVFKDGTGKINYNVNQTFSEPMSHFMSGVLRTFGLLALIGVPVGLIAAVVYFWPG